MTLTEQICFTRTYDILGRNLFTNRHSRIYKKSNSETNKIIKKIFQTYVIVLSSENENF